MQGGEREDVALDSVLYRVQMGKLESLQNWI